MAQFDARKEGAVSSEFLRTSQVADPRAVTVTSCSLVRGLLPESSAARRSGRQAGHGSPAACRVFL